MLEMCNKWSQMRIPNAILHVENVLWWTAMIIESDMHDDLEEHGTQQ